MAFQGGQLERLQIKNRLHGFTGVQAELLQPDPLGIEQPGQKRIEAEGRFNRFVVSDLRP